MLPNPANNMTLRCMESLTTRLKVALSLKGWRRNRLAEETGLSANTITRVLNGKHEPTMDTLAKLAQALEVSIDWLLDDKGGLDPYEYRTQVLNKLERRAMRAIRAAIRKKKYDLKTIVYLLGGDTSDWDEAEDQEHAL